MAGAVYDGLRLQGSKIENSDDLLETLRQAVDIIDPGAKKYLKSSTKTAASLEIIITSPLPEATVETEYCETLLAMGGTPRTDGRTRRRERSRRI